MLVEFSVGNFLSFKEPATFSMVAANIKEHEETNWIELNKVKLLKSAVIYGANASGKSNLFLALDFMKTFIFESSKESQIDEKIEVDSFKLSKETIDEPSFFEVIFLKENIRYRYGFLVDEEKIHEEWLYSSKKYTEKELFVRNETGIKVANAFKEGKGLENKTRKNALFLSVCANFNGEIAQVIFNWFHNFNIISGLGNGIMPFTVSKLQEKDFKDKIIKYLKVADMGIEDISVEKFKIPEEDLPEDLPDSLKKIVTKERSLIITHHKRYNEENKYTDLAPFNAEARESKGTLKLLSLSAPLIDTIENGGILVVDELDAKFHPLITRFIIQLFNSINNKRAQLIFNTHDTTHLNKDYFRRDQIWFAEKDRYGRTELYSLVEYKIDETKVRNDATYSKDYILGKYGAVPYVGVLENLGDIYGNGQFLSQEEERDFRFKEGDE